MLQDQGTCRENFERLLERVKQSGEVWGLRSSKGWANCPSDDHESRDVLVFWSDRAYAAQHAKEGWKDYEPTCIPLGAFVERWLPGMQKDRVLVGPNWDSHLCGQEIEAEEIARRLAG